MAAIRFIPALLLALSAICAHARESAEEAPDQPAVAELIALDDAWMEAEVHGDKAALERILHEDFLTTYPSGRTVDRTAFIDAILSNPPAPFTVRHESIRVHGDTALIIDVSEDGATKFTWIAVKRDGEWRAISETFSKVRSP